MKRAPAAQRYGIHDNGFGFLYIFDPEGVPFSIDGVQIAVDKGHGSRSCIRHKIHLHTIQYWSAPEIVGIFYKSDFLLGPVILKHKGAGSDDVET